MQETVYVPNRLSAKAARGFGEGCGVRGVGCERRVAAAMAACRAASFFFAVVALFIIADGSDFVIGAPAVFAGVSFFAVVVSFPFPAPDVFFFFSTFPLSLPPPRASKAALRPFSISFSSFG
ncbi:hypothetical protein BDD12DRAFT_865870 [Trichophaea hybrida]|nr:hypothetical protein BDD12DRAFT_865870 [Trichophaea hybrida]